MERLKRVARRVIRRIFGVRSMPELWLRRAYRSVVRRWRRSNATAIERVLGSRYIAWRSGAKGSFSGENFTVVWSRSLTSPKRVGIYAKGSCDLPAIFATAPHLRESLDGTCAIFLERGGVASARSDVLLQSLAQQPHDLVEQLTEKLALPAGFFEPRLFESSFRLPGLGKFPKSVVVLSIAADVVRPVYQHRDHGLLVDPGGWWLNEDMSKVLGNLEKVAWFRQTFERVGKIHVDDFYANFSKIITMLRGQTGAHVLVLNTLEVEPGDTTHTYQLVTTPNTLRRRQFNLALIDMSKELDFPIVDVDRVLKEEGVGGQLDFAHFRTEDFRPLGSEIVRILQELDAFSMN